MPSSLVERGSVEGAIVDIRPEIIKATRGNVECASWGEGPAALMIHGAMGGYDQGILLALTTCYPRFRFISVSRPGYLGTPLSSGRTAQEQADLCAEVLDAYDVKNTAVIAISGGGPVALQLALRHSERCRAVVMVSACSAKLDVPLPLQWHLMKLMARIPGVMAAMRRKIEKDPEGTARQSIPDDAQRKRTVHDPEVGPLFLALRTSILERISKRIPGSENDIRQTRAEMPWPLETITAPVLAVHGTRDSIVPFVQAQTLVERLRNAELMAIEGGEHVSIFTHRNEVRSRIDKFLGTSFGK